jgi:ribosomal protein S27AE
MAFVSSGHSSLEMTCGRPLCPRCRAPMWTLRVEPEKTAQDDRMFQCPRCEDSQNIANPKNRNWCSAVKMSALDHKRK